MNVSSKLMCLVVPLKPLHPRLAGSNLLPSFVHVGSRDGAWGATASVVLPILGPSLAFEGGIKASGCLLCLAGVGTVGAAGHGWLPRPSLVADTAKGREGGEPNEALNQT
jgi:hypothetical protein